MWGLLDPQARKQSRKIIGDELRPLKNRLSPISHWIKSTLRYRNIATFSACLTLVLVSLVLVSVSAQLLNPYDDAARQMAVILNENPEFTQHLGDLAGRADNLKALFGLNMLHSVKTVVADIYNDQLLWPSLANKYPEYAIPLKLLYQGLSSVDRVWQTLDQVSKLPTELQELETIKRQGAKTDKHVLDRVYEKIQSSSQAIQDMQTGLTDVESFLRPSAELARDSQVRKKLIELSGDPFFNKITQPFLVEMEFWVILPDQLAAQRSIISNDLAVFEALEREYTQAQQKSEKSGYAALEPLVVWVLGRIPIFIVLIAITGSVMVLAIWLAEKNDPFLDQFLRSLRKETSETSQNTTVLAMSVQAASVESKLGNEPGSAKKSPRILCNYKNGERKVFHLSQLALAVKPDSVFEITPSSVSKVKPVLSIEPTKKRYFLHIDHSSTPIFLNCKQTEVSQILNNGDLIELPHLYLIFLSE